MNERVLILGSGQDASILADLFLAQGRAVHLLHRHSSTPDHLWRIAHCRDRLTLHEGDVLDTGSIVAAIEKAAPHLILNCADQDNIDFSLRTPGYSMDVTAGSVMKMLEAVRQLDPSVRWYQPLSITMFGDSPPPQDEKATLDPPSPYSVAKAAAWHVCRYFRRKRGMFVSTAILCSHDSPRRSPHYLLQTIARQAVAVSRGEAGAVRVGNPDAVVDVGCAREFMEAVVAIMSLPTPDDFVVGTGVGHKARDLGEAALQRAGVPNPRTKVSVDPSFSRPGKTPEYRANYDKLRTASGWVATKDARQVVCELVDHLLGKERATS